MSDQCVRAAASEEWENLKRFFSSLANKQRRFHPKASFFIRHRRQVCTAAEKKREALQLRQFNTSTQDRSRDQQQREVMHSQRIELVLDIHQAVWQFSIHHSGSSMTGDCLVNNDSATSDHAEYMGDLNVMTALS